MESSPTTLLSDFKEPDELLRLYDRIIDLEEEVSSHSILFLFAHWSLILSLHQIVAKMEFDDGVKSIEGAKVDGTALWLLVRWETDKRSWVPAQVRPHPSFVLLLSSLVAS